MPHDPLLEFHMKQKRVTKIMLEDLCNLQHETLKKRDAYAKVLCNKINELTDDYAELEKAAKKLTKNYLINYKDCTKIWKLNRDLALQNAEFLRDRNDVIRKYNFLVQCSKFIPKDELAAWNKKLPENPQYETEEFKADVLESGKVRYEVKLKPLTLPSGKKIKLATTKKEEDVS